MQKQSISLCMIIRNEEKYLEQCLNSVKNLVDEIIIVDTGSTDKTKAIWKKFDFVSKIKFFDFIWVDDFSAARNESLMYATKDWVLVLDADEVLGEEGVKTIKEIVDNKDEVDAFLLLQKNYTNETQIAGFVNEGHKKNGKNGNASDVSHRNRYAGWYGSLIARLFRNHKGYKFEGTVHELVEPSIESKNGKIAATNIAIYHYGNADPAVTKKKMQLYLELCKKKLKQNPADSSYYECGVLYRENEKFDEAIKSFKKTIELNPKHSMAFYELGIVYEQQKNYDDAIKNYTESLRLKENSEAFQNLGVCYLKKGMFKEAYRNLTKSMLLNPNKCAIYNNLGAVLEKIGNYDNAVQMLEIGVKLNPNNTIGYYNLALVLDKKGEFGKAIEAYEKAVELGHKKSEDIKKRIKQIKSILANMPKYSYGFKVGG